MQIIFLSDAGTAVMDLLAWVFFHLSIGFWCSRIPVSFFNTHKPLYITRNWEKDGEIYQKIFRVKAWKKYIPSGGSLYANTFKIKHLPCYTKEYLERWLKESCRAEFCHWVLILPGFLFFLWNNMNVAWLMVAYAVLNNMVPIIMQRFNRPRVSKLLKQIQKKSFPSIDISVLLAPQKSLSNSYQ